MRVLIISAHPDDEILGAGGTWHKFQKRGDLVSALIISQGRADPIDQRFDLLGIRNVIDKLDAGIKSFLPDMVITHSIHDINEDHRVIHKACLVACRPHRTNVKALYAFDSTLSPMSYFKPVEFITLSQEDIDFKVKQMEDKYKNEMNSPVRTKDGIITQARFWGNKVGVEYAEAFEVVFKIS